MTQPRFLNDPHELSVEINAQSLMRNFYDHLVEVQGCLPENARDIATRNIVNLVIDHVAHVNSAREDVGILSLCDTSDNMLLWAHYAHEHRGAVLELDVSELITTTDENTIQCVAEVIYSDARVDYIAERIPLWMTLAYKSQAWAYEREWRLFKSLNNLRRKTDDIFVIDLPPSAIKSVTFGARASGSEESDTLALLASTSEYRHVAIHKASFTSNLVGLKMRTAEEFAWAILHGEHHFGDHWREIFQWVNMEVLEQAESGVGLP